MSNETTPAPSTPAAPAAAEGAGTPGGAAAAGAPAAAQAAEAKRLLKLKLNGQEVEWPEERVIAEAQRSAAGHQKFEEAARLRKEVEEVRKRFKEDPDGFVRAMGYEDPLDFYRSEFAKRMQAKLMTPEQKAAHERDRELEALRREKSAREEQEKAQRLAERRERAVQEYEQGVQRGFAAAKLPVNAFTVEKAALVAQAYINDGVDPDWNVVAQVVKEDLFGGMRKTLEEMDPEELAGLLGEGIDGKLSKRRLDRLKDPAPALKRPANAPKAPSPGARSYLTMDELRERNERIKRGEE